MYSVVNQKTSYLQDESRISRIWLGASLLTHRVLTCSRLSWIWLQFFRLMLFV